MPDVLLSVVIPAYNAAAWLPRAIDSVLAQTLKPCEIIVADDGSTDETAEVVERYAGAVRYVRFEHSGVYAVRNAILTELKGSWFFNLDSDNWIEPDFLAEAFKVIEMNAGDENFAFVYPDMQRFGEMDDFVERPDFSIEKLKKRNYLDMNSLIRTEVARRFGFDPAFNTGQGDYDFFLTLVENGFVGVPLRGSPLHYCVHRGSISSEGRRRFRHLELADKILAKHASFFSDEESKLLRDGAKRGCANAIWVAAFEEYEIGRYRSCLKYAWKALRCDHRMLSCARIRLMAMSLAVCASGGILWASRPLEQGESRWLSIGRIWRRIRKKSRFWFDSIVLRLRGIELPTVWVRIKGADVGSSSPRIRTRRSVEMQDYKRWHWLESGAEPSDGEYVLELTPGDELYPDSIFRMACEAQKLRSDIVYADHAWSNGERSRQPCLKPDFRVEELKWNSDILASSMMVKYDLWMKSEKSPDRVCKEASSATHIRTVLMNKIVPFATTELPEVDEHAETPRVAIVIPTKNRARLLSNAIRSIHENTDFTNYEILVVDNGSTDEDAIEYLKNSGLKYISRPEAFNYSALNNAGAHATDAPLVLFLNDDIEIPPDERQWLSSMVATISENNVGIVGSRLDYPCGATQHAGIGVFPMKGGGLMMRNLFAGQVDRNFWVTRRRECLAVTGACQLVRRDAFEAVKGYDGLFPIVCNDVDFCLRVREAGWRVIYQPAARLLHHEGVSSSGCKTRAAEIEMSHKLFNSRWSEKMDWTCMARPEWEGLT